MIPQSCGACLPVALFKQARPKLTSSRSSQKRRLAIYAGNAERSQYIAKVAFSCQGWHGCLLSESWGIFAVPNSLLHCNKDLEIRFTGFTVRDMEVVYNNSISREVTSGINLTLALQKTNPNSWVRPRCDFYLRKVKLIVGYMDSLISIFDLVYIVGDLKPTSSHTVSTTLTGNLSHVSDEAGVALEAQLLRDDNVTFVLDIIVWYLLEPGLNRLVNHTKICEVVAKTPQQASMRSRVRGFTSAECVDVQEP